MRHVGILKNLGTPIILVFPQLPDDPEHCLVVDRPSEATAHRVLDRLNEVIQSKEAQSTDKLYEVLHSHIFDSGRTLLEELHYGGFLKKVRVEDVVLTPAHNQMIELKNMVGKNGAAVPNATDTTNISLDADNPGSTSFVEQHGTSWNESVSSKNVLNELRCEIDVLKSYIEEIKVMLRAVLDTMNERENKNEE